MSAQPDVSLSALEKQLSDYLAAPSTATPFDLAAVPRRATETRRPGAGQGVIRGACSSKAQGRELGTQLSGQGRGAGEGDGCVFLLFSLQRECIPKLC